MVVILCNQLLHLLDRVLPAGIHMDRDIWDLRPRDDSLLIAQIIKILVVLIVCQTYGICPHGENQLHVLLMHFARERISYAKPVLMA